MRKTPIIIALIILAAMAIASLAQTSFTGVNATGVNLGISPYSYPNLGLWLRSDSGIALTSSNTVSEWTDRTANAYVFRQPSGIRQPIYVSNVVNGLPAVFFDGVDDWMTNKIAGVNMRLGYTNPFTVFAVYQPAVNNNGVLLGFGGTNGAVRLTFSPSSVAGSKPCLINRAGEDGSAVTSTGFNSVVTWSLATLTFDGSTETMQLNTNAAVTRANQMVGGAYHATASVGAWVKSATVQNFFFSNAAEIIIFTRQLSANEISDMQNRYINSRYKIY
jgi:hypothetical protein